MLDENPNIKPPFNSSVRGVPTMHADTSNSDCSSLNGHGFDPDGIGYTFNEGMATFPTIQLRRERNLMAHASSFRQHPVRKDILGDEDDGPTITAEVWFIDGDTGQPMCHPRAVPQSSIFGGVYAYLDRTDDGLVVISATTPEDKTQFITKTLKYKARRGPKHDLTLQASVDTRENGSVLSANQSSEKSEWKGEDLGAWNSAVDYLISLEFGASDDAGSSGYDHSVHGKPD